MVHARPVREGPWFHSGEDEVMKRIKKVYKNIAKRYAAMYAGMFHPDDVHVDKFLSLLPRHAKILDVGCGVGDSVAYFLKRGFRTEGIDLSEDMIRLAKEHAPKGKFKVLDMRKMKYRKSSFDGVYAFQSLVHLKKKDVSPVLKKFNRILKPNGILFLALQKGRGEGEVYWELAGQKIFINRYGFKEIEKLLRDNGFKIIYKASRKPLVEDVQLRKIFLICEKR